MEEKKARQLSLGLIESSGLAYLGTVDGDGYPQIRAMANLKCKAEYPELEQVFAGHEGDFLMYFATGTRSVKMGHIKANPKVSIYFCDAKGMQTLLLGGTAKAVSDEKLKKAIWQDRWTKHFEGGVDDPEYAVISVKPDFARGWCGQEAFEFKLK